ncbi:MAG: transketolase [Armatimonadetes bacterium]|nr:transketolase [Armatimonadota bacterium]
MRDAFIAQLTELARTDPRIFLITGDLGFGVLNKFAEEFPNQFLNAGVAEQNMTMLATGLAMEGRVVFTYSIGNFPTLRPLEFIRNDACYHHANVNVVCIGGGFSYGSLGISHHATEDLSILRALPELTVVAPGDDYETMEATKALVNKSGAGYLRLDRSSMIVDAAQPFELGRARVVREGTDLTLISTGGMLGEALIAANKLSECGIEARVVSLHTIKPLDTEAIRLAAVETGGIITLEEHTVLGGLGGAVAETCLEKRWIPGFFVRMGLQDVFSKVVGSQEYLRSIYKLDAPAIVETSRKFVEAGQRAVVEGAIR